MGGEQLGFDRAHVGVRLFGLMAATVALVATCALALGCEPGPSVSAHSAIGTWGVATQSGQLVEAVELRADGSYTITDAAGTGVREGSGRLLEVDSATLRTEEDIGPGGVTVRFTVSGDRLRLEWGSQVLSEFERMPQY